jgi:hypothetical protein
MRTLLIYPEYPATFWSFKYALKFIRKRAALPREEYKRKLGEARGEVNKMVADAHG